MRGNDFISNSDLNTISAWGMFARSRSVCAYCQKMTVSRWDFYKSDLDPQQYQLLFDRGWQREGCLYSKVNIATACCKPFYSRLDVLLYQIKKDQKRTIRKVCEMLLGNGKKKEEKEQKAEKEEKEEKAEKEEKEEKAEKEEKEEKAEKEEKEEKAEKEEKEEKAEKEEKEEKAEKEEKEEKAEKEEKEEKAEKEEKEEKAEKEEKEEKAEKEEKEEKAEKEEKKEQGKKQAIKKAKEEVKEEEEAMMKKVALKLNQLIRENPGDFWGLVGEENLADQSAAEKLQLQPVAEKLKCFVSKPEEKSSFYCNYGMLLFGLNKKLFRKDFSVLDFVRAVRPFIEGHGQKDEDFNLQLELSGYLLFILDKQITLSKEKVENENISEKLFNQMIPSQKRQQQTFQKPQKIQQNPKIIISSDEIIFGKLKIKFVKAQCSKEALKMYQKHSKQIHKRDNETRSSYLNFLCKKAITYKNQETSQASKKTYLPSWSNPAQEPQPIVGTRIKRMGCYHMNYYLEEKLIAVGVVDILPHALLSFYFFHDLEYRSHRLGVFSTLVEIQYVRWMQLSFPEFRYYSMDTYVQNNSKLSYKVNYGPCELLCPETLTFLPFTPDLEAQIAKISTKKNTPVRLAPLQIPLNPDFIFPSNIDQYIEEHLKIVHKSQLVKFSSLDNNKYKRIINALREHVKVVGREFSSYFMYKF